jgi:AraC family transcriptional regulator of adaptative response / DNA-3-methyladenine glycosylase II
MYLDPEICWRASRSRDRRFDGLFFNGVITTGVYCRPICPVVGPKRENVRFYPSAAAAEAAGFRACRRCRPETAPGTPAWLGSSGTISRAMRLISGGPLTPQGADELAARLGVGSRHLRRLFTQHLGTSPLAIARTRRTHFARRLIDETELPMSEVALASGYGSIRQFNHAIRASFGRTPSQLRRDASGRREVSAEGEIALRLAYRPPFDWDGLLAFLRERAIPGVEHVHDTSYHRTIAIDQSVGSIKVGQDAKAQQLVLRVRLPNFSGLVRVVEGVRRIFDLSANPLQITNDLRRDPELARIIDARPGLRIPGTWDPFELCVRAVLGQQVSVKAATTLSGRLVRMLGKPVETYDRGPLTYLFPSPQVLMEADIAAIGIPRTRAETIHRLAKNVTLGKLTLSGDGQLEEVLGTLREIPGIGDWTAQYIAMRALGEPDAFPASDLGLRGALATNGTRLGAAALAERAERWRPWRAYAAMWLWTRGYPKPNPHPRRMS